MRYKRLVKIFFSINIFMLALIATSLFIYDPLHIYHKSWITNDSRIHGNMRLQAAGIINNYDFDSIILGTSMMKGTSSIKASEELNSTFVNLSADGSSVYERRVILNHALKKKKLKHVIYSLDTGLDLNLKKNNRTLPLKDFDYLYDSNPVNDLKIYWNKKFVKCLSTLSTSTECLGSKRSLVRPLKWFESIHNRNKEISGIKNWIENKKGRGKNVYTHIKKHLNQKPKKSINRYEDRLVKTYTILDEGLLTFVQGNKDVAFHIVFPPYSRFIYALWKNKNPKKYLLYRKTVEYLVQESTKYENMYVYILDDLEYLSDLNNYRDMRHYNTEMNSVMIDYIAQKKHTKTIKELDAIMKKADKMNEKYNLSKELDYLIDSYKFRTGFEKKYENKKLSIDGWVLTYKVDKAELHLGKKILASMPLAENEDVLKLHPQYKQLFNSFNFKNILVPKKHENVKLIFKYKNRIVKKVRIFKTNRIEND